MVIEYDVVLWIVVRDRKSRVVRDFRADRGRNIFLEIILFEDGNVGSESRVTERGALTIRKLSGLFKSERENRSQLWANERKEETDLNESVRGQVDSRIVRQCTSRVPFEDFQSTQHHTT